MREGAIGEKIGKKCASRRTEVIFVIGLRLSNTVSEPNEIDIAKDVRHSWAQVALKEL